MKTRNLSKWELMDAIEHLLTSKKVTVTEMTIVKNSNYKWDLIAEGY